jgi:hypothetical protein
MGTPNLDKAKEAKAKELEAIEDRIKQQEEFIELKEATERLHENEDFQKIILSGYFEKEGMRLYGLLTEPSHLKRDVIENINDKLLSIRNLKQYFLTIATNAHMAPDIIAEEKQYRSEVVARPDEAFVEV